MTAPRRAEGAETIVRGARKVVVTHPERVLFPRERITKLDLVHYYRDVAHFMLPYLRGRPLTLQRWPDGIHGSSFFEKNVPRGAPEWVPTLEVPSPGSKRGVVRYPICDDEATLLWAANLAAITLHVWMSRVGSLERPDWLLFDLDPFEGCAVATLAEVAVAVRRELDAIGLPPLVKTTGGKGLHVMVPLATAYGYDDVRTFGEVIARRIAARMPRHVTLERSKSKRPRGVVYLDWVQVGQGKTIVPPFCVRARDGAPVSTPLAWDEVDALRESRARDTASELSRWNLTNVPALLADRGDPWKKPWARKHRLEPALARARALWSE